MLVADYLVNVLENYKVTDAFGIPGGVILDFLYALSRHPTITPHLTFHEQTAGFAALGYGQVTGRLGHAYATRGPGILNLITPIVDAYCDSIPALFITAHATPYSTSPLRVQTDQELDIISAVSGFTKYANRIENVNDLPHIIDTACRAATTGRPGPVLLDFYSALWKKDVSFKLPTIPYESQSELSSMLQELEASLSAAKRPVLLIGDGARSMVAQEQLKNLSKIMPIPILSSRFASDLVANNSLYYGYIGSHGCRFANFILSKADLIIAIGNRINISPMSDSFKSIFQSKKIIRFDIDCAELQRQLPNVKSFQGNAKEVLSLLLKNPLKFKGLSSWISICNQIKQELWYKDTEFPVNTIAFLLEHIPQDAILTSDVGNNEFWLARAYIQAKIGNRILYSKSLGALGSSIGKAIGSYYATKKPVYCFTGDQGMQFNIQDLQFIAMNNLPITIVILSNDSSGMILDREVRKGYSPLHVDKSSGYGHPSFRKIADAYQIHYMRITKNLSNVKFPSPLQPNIIEISIDPHIELIPYLPKGYPYQKLYPEISMELYNILNTL